MIYDFWIDIKKLTDLFTNHVYDIQSFLQSSQSSQEGNVIESPVT